MRTFRTPPRVVGALLGAGLATALLLGAQPSSSFSALPARVSLAVDPTGELATEPPAPTPVLRRRAVVPGAPPAGASFVVRNQTGRRLDVGFRARAELRDLDGLLRVRLRAGRRTIAETTLQGLREGSPATLPLRVGGEVRVAVELSVPAGITDGYQGRSIDIALEPLVTVRD